MTWTAFIWHGSPMNAIEENIYTQSWKEIGTQLWNPDAVVVISSHWITHWKTEIGWSDNPEIIYDMYWFPDELYNQIYTPQGSNRIAQEIQEFLWGDTKVNPNRWIDHGIWSILCHIFPDWNIPIIPMSIDYVKSPKYHFELWKKLQYLRDKNIAIIGSGNFVHNLSLIDWWNSTKYIWAIDFNEKIISSINKRDFDDIIHFEAWWNISKLAHPSIDHLLPLLTILGTIRENDAIKFYTPKIILWSLWMTSLSIYQ